MKISELIKKLEEIEDKDRKVVLEGCDCTGEWNGEIEEYESKWSGKCLLLKRDI